MALSFNGNILDTGNGAVTYNGIELDKLQLNGITVWESKLPINSEVFSSSSPQTTTFTVPYTGVYRIELVGAGGGCNTYLTYTAGSYYKGASAGGSGGYQRGLVTLTKDDVINITIGSLGTNNHSSSGYDTGAAGTGGTTQVSNGFELNSYGGNGGHITLNNGGAGGSTNYTKPTGSDLYIAQAINGNTGSFSETTSDIHLYSTKGYLDAYGRGTGAQITNSGVTYPSDSIGSDGFVRISYVGAWDNIGVQLYGNCINTNSILSTFNAFNYAYINSSQSMLTDPYSSIDEMQIKFKYIYSTYNNQGIISYGDSNGYANNERFTLSIGYTSILINENQKLAAYSYSFNDGSDYILNISKSNNQYIVKISENGNSFQQLSADSSTLIESYERFPIYYNNTYKFTFGLYARGSSTSDVLPLQGTIDLTQSYFKFKNKYIWLGA